MCGTRKKQCRDRDFIRKLMSGLVRCMKGEEGLLSTCLRKKID